MTREEAIKLLKQYQGYEPMDYGQKLRHSFDLTDETVDTLLAALTLLAQEQMERVWTGCDFCKKELNDYPLITAIGEYGDSINSYTPGYCPLCGRPLVPEAWKETRKRLEALYGNR